MNYLFLALCSVVLLTASSKKESVKVAAPAQEIVTNVGPSEPPIGDLMWWKRPGSSFCQCFEYQSSPFSGNSYVVVDDSKCYMAYKPNPCDPVN